VIPQLLTTTLDFPPIETALTEPNGLLAFGGDLSAERLIQAYQLGIFPWYDASQPILWWSPHPRAVLFPKNLKISKSLMKTLKKGVFNVTYDKAFEQVIQHCQAPRKYAEGTWITEEMQKAYIELHRRQYAHSIECWQEGRLVGGLYGVTLGKLFFGESMFSLVTDSSKVAFVYLVKHLESFQYPLIDCQVGNSHLESLGTSFIDRQTFKNYLIQNQQYSLDLTHWQTPFQFSFD